MENQSNAAFTERPSMDYSYLKLQLLQLYNGDLVQAKVAWEWVKPA